MRAHALPTFSVVRHGCLAFLGALAVLVFAVPAPATAASTPASSRAADLCARVGAEAGFPTDDALITAVAVALAESGCSATARGHNGPTRGCPDGSTDRGLWQINSCYHSEVPDDCTFDPQCNADAAYRISARGTNFRPWTTYKTGRYRAFLDRARAAVSRLG